MICPECKGKGEVKYYRETDRDEYSVTVKGVVDVCHTCHGSGVKPPTNADHIRSMSDEELARFLAEVENRRSAAGGGAIWKGAAHAKEWLKQPYKVEKI